MTEAPTVDKWEELLLATKELFQLNNIVVSNNTIISTVHTIVGVLCMKRKCFLGTERAREDLRNHLMKADDSRTGKGLLATFIIKILERVINKKEEILVTAKLTKEGIIGGYNTQGQKKEEVMGNANKLFVYHDEFHNTLQRKDSDDVLGVIRQCCNNYGSPDNLMVNSARSQASFEPYHGRATFMFTLISSKLEERKRALIEEGTFQRFDVDYDELDVERSKRIMEAQKIKVTEKEERVKLYEKQKEVLGKIVTILNSIGHYNPEKDLFEDYVVYINDDYYNECVDKATDKIEKEFQVNPAFGTAIHSLNVTALNMIKKCSARIAIVRGKKSVTKAEINWSFEFVMEKQKELIQKCGLLTEDIQKKYEIIRDLKLVLGHNVYCKTEVNKKMMDYWNMGETKTISKIKLVDSIFIRQKMDKTNKIYVKIRR